MTAENEEQIVQAVEEFFFASDDFENVFKKFAKDNIEKFRSLPEDMDDAVNAEQKLEWIEVYNEFQKLYETQIETFLKTKGLSVETFYETLQKNNGDVNSKAFDLSSILLATAEYGVFVQLMHSAVHSSGKN